MCYIRHPFDSPFGPYTGDRPKNTKPPTYTFEFTCTCDGSIDELKQEIKALKKEIKKLKRKKKRNNKK